MNKQHKLEPIRLDTYKPLRDVVSEALRQAIREGVLQPGERLMEIQLADELGVSRTPIREASSSWCRAAVRTWPTFP